VGVSAGSMVLTPRIGETFVSWPDARDDSGLGIVEFSLFPPPDLFPQNTTAHAEQWAAELGPGARCFVVDDETALVVVDGRVEVVSEGVWRELSAD